jgi:uncharacterized surface protein with fasciclin (FAS1) repeats
MPVTAGARTTLLLFATAVVLACTSALPACHAAHNITAILSGHRDLAEFGRELAATGLADDIDDRNTITVLAVDDAHMAPLKARGLPRETLRHVLSLHVLVDYYDDAKLHRLPGGSADVSTLFQASGDAPGSAGMVRVAERRGGRVAFAPEDDAGSAAAAVFYVGPVHEAPYNISVLWVSGVISSPAAEAPAAAADRPPSRRNVSDVMSENGCGRFAGLVAATGDAAATFERQADGGGGLTLFCPADRAVEAFQPTLNSLSADARLAVVLYHGAPGHHSMQALRAGDQDLRTAASLDGGRSHLALAVRNVRGRVTLLASATRDVARVTRTLADEEAVAVYMIDAVLVPGNLTAQGTAGGTEHGELTSGSGGEEDGGGGGVRQSSGSRALAPAPCWLPRGWFAAWALLLALLAAFAASG